MFAAGWDPVRLGARLQPSSVCDMLIEAPEPTRYNRNCVWCSPPMLGIIATRCHCKVACGAVKCEPADLLLLVEAEPGDRLFHISVPLAPIPVFRASDS